MAEEKARLLLDSDTIYDIINVEGQQGRLAAFQDICASPLWLTVCKQPLRDKSLLVVAFVSVVAQNSYKQQIGLVLQINPTCKCVCFQSG